ncbi:MAG: type II secretion system major pseudopilin GspG [Planctomycetota bacterium]
MRNHRLRIRSRAAFTLLEVLMVVAIIGLLAAFVVPNLFGAREGAKIDLTQALVDSGINGALELYRTHMDRYPQEDDGGLMALVEEPEDEDELKKWRGPYVKNAKDLIDPWGNELIYECPGEYNERSYDLSSAGPDGDEGSDDDIKNWEED